MTDDPSALVVDSPFSHYSQERFTKKLTKVMDEVCGSVHVLGANEPHQSNTIYWEKLEISPELPRFQRYCRFLQSQITSISYSDEVGFDFYFIRPSPYILPALWFRFGNKDSGTLVTQRTHNFINDIVSELTLFGSERLIVESESVLDDWRGGHKKKMCVGATYVDGDKYHLNIPYSNRKQFIGFLGILIKRKGLRQLMEASPKVIQNEPNTEIKIAGDGPLADEMKMFDSQYEAVDYLGYLPEEEVVDFYNSLELFVLPTKAEGLPNVALEAMACGTPVLATDVGGLPDLIDDGENGFLMEDNAPDTIKMNILRALNTDLQSVSDRARETVREKYSFEDAVRRYEQIITQ